MTEQELKIITDLYGNICDCSPSDDYMAEHCGEWCEKNCGKVEDWQCLQKYIEEKQNEIKGKWACCGKHKVCSVCGEWAITTTDEDGEEIDVLSNFCPNCGADMREEKTDG